MRGHSTYTGRNLIFDFSRCLDFSSGVAFAIWHESMRSHRAKSCCSQMLQPKVAVVTWDTLFYENKFVGEVTLWSGRLLRRRGKASWSLLPGRYSIREFTCEDGSTVLARIPLCTAKDWPCYSLISTLPLDTTHITRTCHSVAEGQKKVRRGGHETLPSTRGRIYNPLTSEAGSWPVRLTVQSQR